MAPRRRVLVDIVEMGRRGGLAYAANHTAKQRKERAQLAARKRWRAYRKAKRQEARAAA